ncbi:MAG TPA: hypothetical protein VM791_05635 [Vicinamibacterales bacterium]|jgi:hypothetical protein|nr:hypothetical protein [Vicinamibacterales bacterium]
MRPQTLRKLAWLYTAGFIGIFIITHTPALTDENGLSFGLFKIDPVDDFVHLLSGIAGFIVAWRAHSYIPLFFKLVGLAYMGDAIVGMTTSRGLLDGSLFMHGPASPDFSVRNWALNLPHIVLSGIALVIGFMKRARASR